MLSAPAYCTAAQPRSPCCPVRGHAAVCVDVHAWPGGGVGISGEYLRQHADLHAVVNVGGLAAPLCLAATATDLVVLHRGEVDALPPIDQVGGRSPRWSSASPA